MKLWIKISIIYVPRDCPHKIKIVCSGKVENYVTVRTQACVLWPLNVLCDLDLCGMDPGQGHCTLSQWGQHLYQVRAWTRNVTDGQTDEVQSYNALPNPWRGLIKLAVQPLIEGFAFEKQRKLNNKYSWATQSMEG